MMLVLELVSASLIFVVLVACTIIPYCILIRGGHRDAKSTLSMSICNCIACGIFLSTCFLGLIPHVRHQEMVIWKNRQNGTIGVEDKQGLALGTEAVVLLGFLLILLIEQIIAMFSSPSQKHSSPIRGPTMRTLLESDIEDHQPLVDTTMDHDDDGMQDIIFRSSSPAMDKPTMSGHSHALPIEDGLTARTLFLLLGLSIHSVFEGVALGVQRERSDFVNILIAVMFHEILCCFAYGVSMAQQRTPVKSAVTTVLILSASIPAGMIVAVVVDQFETTNSMLLRYILEGLAAGTFVYVACVEMLSSELGHSHGHSHGGEHSHDHDGHSHHSHCTPFLKAVAVAGGVAIFWGLKLLIGSAHG